MGSHSPFSLHCFVHSGNAFKDTLIRTDTVIAKSDSCVLTATTF